MRTILIIAGKDLLLRWRDRLGFFWWMVGFPLLIAVLIGAIFSGVLEGPSKPMAVAVVDQADTQASREFAEALGETGTLTLSRLTLTEAQDAVRRGRLAAFVVLRDPFRLSPAIFFGKPLPIAIGVDPLRQAEAAYLRGTVIETAANLLRAQYSDPQRRPELIDAWRADLGHNNALTPLARGGLDAALSMLDRHLGLASPASQPGEEERAPSAEVEMLPVDAAHVRPASSFEICFPLGIAWGLIGLAAELAMSIVQEREAGTLLRLRVAPIRRLHLLAGNGLASWIASVAVMLFLLAVGWLVFGVRLQNGLVLLMVIACTALCFVGITTFLSVLGRTESAVGGSAWACLLVMAMLGGGMVPQIFMPAWMETASDFSPIKWTILGLEGGIWRGFTPAEAARPCAVLLLQGLLFGGVGAVLSVRLDR